ncbi:tetratricopeptide repeat-containing sensor histidine kinase [Flavobacterium pallidum]|uniref:histidine kinase n=1 Tax=Flavobacterium pallidum TaxID=2172098 RepID=A0A2S1SGL3_9FLAO|nr:tetratricopeptide repeat protein [Flavobacterium pallidum]AWI25556.1 hypothetical protein HYN49_06410 [Flavobacterium pallidum]
MKRYHIDILVIPFLLLFGTHAASAQFEKKIDSLKAALIKYEAGKSKDPSRYGAMADTTKADILYSMAVNYGNLFSPQAGVYGQKSLQLSEKIGYSKGISQALNLLGNEEAMKSNYPLAMQYIQRALKIAEETNDLQGQADYNGNIGMFYAKLSKYPEAISYMMKSLQIAKRRNDSFSIAGNYNNIGVMYSEQGKYEEALKSYAECLKVQLKTKDYYNSSTSYQNIGDSYFDCNKPAQAMSYFKKALDIAAKYGNKQTAALSYIGIGKIYNTKHENDKALENHLTALKICQEIQDAYGISSVLLHIANDYFGKRDYANALRYVGRSLPMTLRNGELDLTKRAYELNSMIYKALGNYKSAYENQMLFKQTADSIFNYEKEKKFTQLQMSYDFRIVQDSIRAVHQRKELIAKKEVSYQKSIRNSIMIGMSVVVLFLIVLMIQRNKIAQIKKQKALEEERNRISRELHDDLGAQLSTARMFLSSLNANKIPGDFTQTVSTSLELLDSSIADLRKIMGDMHTPILMEKGYLAATEILVNKVNLLHVIKFTLTHHKIDKIGDANVEHQLYRITQELINNTLKYAQAKNVSLDILKRDGQIVLMYEDDGIGYDITRIHRGHGLDNIQKRAESVGGTAEFDSMPGAGARTIIEIPLP